MFSNKASYAPLRSNSAYSATYVAFGTALANPCVAFNVTNTMNGDAIISLDGVTDHLYIAANSYFVWDLRTNSPYLGDLMIPQGTQFYVKNGPTTPSSGVIYLMVLQVTTSAAVAPAAS